MQETQYGIINLHKNTIGSPYPAMCLNLYAYASAVSFQNVGKYIFINFLNNYYFLLS